MWDLPRPGLEPVSPALAGRFSTTAPPGKPLLCFFIFQAKQSVDMQRFSPLVKTFLLSSLMGQVLLSPVPGPWHSPLSTNSQKKSSSPDKALACLPPHVDLSSVSQDPAIQGTLTYIVHSAIFRCVDPWKQAVCIPGSHKSPQRRHIICMFIKKSSQNGTLSTLIFISKCYSLTSDYIPRDTNNP